MFGIGKQRKTPPPKSAVPEKVLVLIDWDNFFLCLFNRFKKEIRIEWRIRELLEWVKVEIGEILEGCGFVFAPEHLNVFHQEVCVNNNLVLFTCPKKKLQTPINNPKTGMPETEVDTVDGTLMWFGRLMMKHPDVGFICLVAGDDDYVPLMEEAERMNIGRVLAPPTIDSLSRSKRLVRLVGRHPKTGKKMLLRLDTL